CFPKLRFSDQRKTPQWQTGLCPNNKKSKDKLTRMGKRLCLTFSVYYFVHPYNITALMICQHVFLNIYIFYRKIVTENGVNSNKSSVFSLLYIQYFLHIRAIIKVSQQFITTQPLHEMAD
ncbi:hypothetical protein, partial [Blautia wexlerae]|uniref:hypothetical protein n=1 Tax=Blautia wexlerae TaxID=418240 RepID=UPI00321AA363